MTFTATPLDVRTVRTGNAPYCSSCEKELNYSLTRAFVKNVGFRLLTTCECGSPISTNDFEIPIHVDSLDVLTEKNLLEREWFHFTSSKDWPVYRDYSQRNWLSSLVRADGNFYAHLGTERSARDRQLALGEMSGRVFRVRIKEDVRIAPGLYVDDNELHEVRCTSKDPEVIRYLNKFEDPGSVSLAVVNTGFDIIDFEEVDTYA